jgi:hypothetical protein
MADANLSRAFVSLSGIEVEAMSAGWKGTKEQPLSKPMRRARRAKGRVKAIPEYELTMEFEPVENDNVHALLDDAWQADAEFPVVYEYEDGSRRSFGEVAIDDIEETNTDGEAQKLTLTLTALTMDFDGSSTFA